MFFKKKKITKGSIVLYKDKPYLVSLMSDDGTSCFIGDYKWGDDKNIIEYCKLVYIRDVVLIKG